MYVNIFKRIGVFFLMVFMIFSMTIPTFSYFLMYYPSKDGTGDTILLTGDSYAGYFATFEQSKDLNILIYAQAAQSTKENYAMMKEAIDAYPQVVVISVGVNDYNKHVSPEDFKNQMEELVSECRAKNKKVILHTFMDYDIDAFGDPRHVYEISDYDNALRKVAEKYNNAFYIDMSDYNSSYFLQPDRIHYNQVFYDELYRRILTALLLF